MYYKISSNRFNRTRYGIWSASTGPGGGYIGNNNIFYNCWRGLNFTGDNSNVKIHCNTFSNLTQPYTEYSIAWSVQGDLSDQGSPTGGSDAPAGNLFYRSSGRFDISATNNAVPSTNCNAFNFCYNHHNLPAYVPVLFPTTLVVPPVRNNNTNFLPNINTCNGPSMLEQYEYNNEAIMSAINAEEDPFIKQVLINEFISYLIKENNITEAISFLQTLEGIQSSDLLIQLYLGQKMFDGAENLVSFFCSQTNDENQRECQYYSILINWGRNGIKPNQMDSLDRISMRDIASSQNRVAGAAQAILLSAFKEEINNWEGNDSSNVRMANPFLTEGLEVLSAYPNPAKTGEPFNVSISDQNNSSFIVEVYSYGGQLIQSFQCNSDNEGLLKLQPISKPGIYQIRIDNDSYHNKFRLVVQ